MYNTTKFTTTITMVVSCILCSCSKSLATERITFYSSSDQVKLSLETPQSALDVTSSLNPKLLTKHIQPKPKTNLIPVLVVGGIVTLGIMAAVISNNKDKDNTVSGANDNNTVPVIPTIGSSGTDTKTTDDGTIPEPSSLTNDDTETGNTDSGAHDKDKDNTISEEAKEPTHLEKQKARLVIRVLTSALKYWENWPGTQEEKEEFTKELVLVAFYLNSNLQNTDLVGSTLMTRALYCSLLRLPKDVLSNALNLDPKGTWTGRDIARNLFDQKDMKTDFINEVVLREYTDEQIEEDYDTVSVIATDIRFNANTYAQFILEQLIGTDITTSDPEIISFLPSNKDSLEDHVITPEGLTNYLKWCADQLTNNVMQDIQNSGTLLQKVNNRSIHLYAKLIDFWNNGPLTLEQKEECTKKIVLTTFNTSEYNGAVSNIVCMIDFIVEKHNANFMKEVNAPFSEEDLEQDRIKIRETVNYILENTDSLSEKILSYFNGPVTTTNQGLLDFFPECEPKDNPNLVTSERLAGYLRGYCKEMSIFLM